MRMSHPHFIFNCHLAISVHLHFNPGFHHRSLLTAVVVLSLVFAGGCGTSNSLTVDPQHEETRAVENQRVCDPIVIQLAGTEHRWQAEYLSLKGSSCGTFVELSESDIHVPIGSRVIFILKSNDYIYTLAIPAFGLKEMAVPDLEFRMQMRPIQCGQYAIVGEEPCGRSGQEGPGLLIVESLADYDEWVGRQQKQVKIRK